MPNQNTEKLNLIDIRTITDETLNSAKGMNDITSTIINNIDNVINKFSGNISSFSKDYAFKNTCINNTYVYHLLDKITNAEGEPLDELQRNNLGSLLIAKALIEGDPVAVVENVAHEEPVVTWLNDMFQDLEPLRKMSLWEHILNWFNLLDNEDREQESTRATPIREHLDGLVADAKTVNNTTHKNILDENHALAKELIKKHEHFNKVFIAQQRDIQKQYFNEMDPDIFKDGIKDLEHFPYSFGGTKRDIDTLTVCAMLHKGYSLEQACDPSFTEGRAAVAKELAELGKNLASSDKEVLHKAREQLSVLAVDATNKYLDSPMPSNDAMENFLDSDKPYYLYKLAHMGFDLLNTLTSLHKQNYIFKDPSEAVLIEVVSSVASCGNFYPIVNTGIMNLTEYQHDDSKSDNDNYNEASRTYAKAMGHALATECIKAHTDTASKTLREYVLKNQSTNIETTSTMRSSIDFADSYFNGNLTNPIKFADTMKDIPTVDKIIKNSAIFSGSVEILTEPLNRTGGTIDQRAARAELAKSVINQMDQLSDTKFSDEKKLLLATKLTIDESFIKRTLMEPDEIKKLKTDPNFLKELAENAKAEADKEQKLKEAALQASNNKLEDKQDATQKTSENSQDVNKTTVETTNKAKAKDSNDNVK